MLPFGPIVAILAIIFGVCIIAFPQILAYMIGSLLIIMGLLFLTGQPHLFKRRR